MARPRSFDPDQALDLARDVFWQNGFHGTSLDDITAATGLAKPSLYAAFGDKNALFLKSSSAITRGSLPRPSRSSTTGHRRAKRSGAG